MLSTHGDIVCWHPTAVARFEHWSLWCVLWVIKLTLKLSIKYSRRFELSYFSIDISTPSLISTWFYFYFACLLFYFLLFLTTRPFPFFYVCHIASATCSQSHNTHTIQAEDCFKEEGLRTSIIISENKNFTGQIYFCQKDVLFWSRGYQNLHFLRSIDTLWCQVSHPIAALWSMEFKPKIFKTATYIYTCLHHSSQVIKITLRTNKKFKSPFPHR